MDVVFFICPPVALIVMDVVFFICPLEVTSSNTYLHLEVEIFLYSSYSQALTCVARLVDLIEVVVQYDPSFYQEILSGAQFFFLEKIYT